MPSKDFKYWKNSLPEYAVDYKHHKLPKRLTGFDLSEYGDILDHWGTVTKEDGQEEFITQPYLCDIAEDRRIDAELALQLANETNSHLHVRAPGWHNSGTVAFVISKPRDSKGYRR